MNNRIEQRLVELGVELPRVTPPAANYIPWVRTGDLVHIAGQVPFWSGELRYVGKLGREFDIAQGQEAARLVLLNVLAQLRAALDGDLDRVVRAVKLNGFINCVPEFGDQPAVMNGASNLLVEIFGEAGRHARAAVGAASLPFGVAVEIDGVFQVR